MNRYIETIIKMYCGPTDSHHGCRMDDQLSGLMLHSHLPVSKHCNSSGCSQCIFRKRHSPHTDLIQLLKVVKDNSK